MLRLGLCCVFAEAKIKFRRTTAKHLSGMTRKHGLQKLSNLCLANAEALMQSLEYCHTHGIGAFRINSQIWPLATHPDVGYAIEDLPQAELIQKHYQSCGVFARKHQLRLSFHPDQFVVLNSPHAHVVRHSIAELEYQAHVAEWVGADVINLHGGGVYGDKRTALERLTRTIDQLSEPVRTRLTLENDDRSFTPSDLLPVCHATKVPLVLDIHHHRCLSDGRTEQEVTQAARETWDREPHFHISSPLHGWQGKDPRPHHDFIDSADFPECWLGFPLTVDVEAKAKEVAIRKLRHQLDAQTQFTPRRYDASLH